MIGRDAMSRLVATYRVRAPSHDAPAIAESLALEQSVEVGPAVVRDAFVRDEIMGRVLGIAETGEDGVHDVRIALAVATTGHDVAQTFNMLFGNSSLHAHVELTDVEFPPAFAARFPGPRFGIDGLRALLGAHDRPLTCAALKPQGLSAQRLAALCRDLVLGGVDIVKDDHGLADQDYAPFAQRVAACQRALAQAARETGRAALYAPSLVGPPAKLHAFARVARDEGAGMVLVAPALVGFAAFHELVASIEVPVLAHPAYAGAARVAPPLLLGRLFRWLGADAVIYPNYGGRFAYTRATCERIADEARRPLGTWKPMLPVPAGGLAVERVDELCAVYGNDIMLLIGGSLLMAGDDLVGRARTFTQAARTAAGRVHAKGEAR
ncbi:MAG TPA: RuBisCO large subunit C-terminal-like domain-containing protein [Casimicrobiaceae bacterium]|nr:RuBisCO large subunit C-terminal-like domain-containing protein [Casimicrobiaceae bacterium]